MIPLLKAPRKKVETGCDTTACTQVLGAEAEPEFE
jgi:hypothetical protein